MENFEMFDEMLAGEMDAAAEEGMPRNKQGRKKKRGYKLVRTSRRLQDSREETACTAALAYVLSWRNEIESLLSDVQTHPDDVEILCRNTQANLLKAYDSCDEECPGVLSAVRDEVHAYIRNLVGTMDITVEQSLAQMIGECTIYAFEDHLAELCDLAFCDLVQCYAKR